MKILQTPKITAEGMERLIGYNWPGNVRELENAVERALILSNNQPLSFTEFAIPAANIHTVSADNKIDADNTQQTILTLDAAMSQHIKKAMTLAKGKVEGKYGAAQRLGINPRTLRNRMRKLGVPFGRDAMALYSE